MSLSNEDSNQNHYINAGTNLQKTILRHNSNYGANLIIYHRLLSTKFSQSQILSMLLKTTYFKLSCNLLKIANHKSYQICFFTKLDS